MYCLRTVAIIVLLTISGNAVGQSTDEPTSRLNAYQCGDLPKSLQVTVQVLDDTDRFLKFKSHFEKELRATGVKIGAKAPVVVTLDVKTFREFQGNDGGALIELRAGQENTDIGKDGTVRFRSNIWSNRSSSVLGGPKQSSRTRSLAQVRVTANVSRQADGNCLWQGEVLHNLGNMNEDKATEQIITILSENLGKTIRNKALAIFP